MPTSETASPRIPSGPRNPHNPHNGIRPSVHAARRAAEPGGMPGRSFRRPPNASLDPLGIRPLLEAAGGLPVRVDLPSPGARPAGR